MCLCFLVASETHPMVSLMARSAAFLWKQDGKPNFHWKFEGKKNIQDNIFKFHSKRKKRKNGNPTPYPTPKKESNLKRILPNQKKKSLWDSKLGVCTDFIYSFRLFFFKKKLHSFSFQFCDHHKLIYEKEIIDDSFYI